MGNRTLAPMIERYISEGLFKFAEEERVQKAIFAAVVSAGVKETHHKKACTHLQKAYDDAHIKAPYGTTAAETAELSMLQDFVKGWMAEFINRGWDILENGRARSFFNNSLPEFDGYEKCGATSRADMFD